jgi:hypothetical protein
MCNISYGGRSYNLHIYTFSNLHSAMSVGITHSEKYGYSVLGCYAKWSGIPSVLFLSQPSYYIQRGLFVVWYPIMFAPDMTTHGQNANCSVMSGCG